MDVVRSAERGEVSRDQLVIILESWSFQPKHRTRGLADDWETRPDSFEAVEYAYLVGLIDDTAYELISRLAGHTSNSRDQDR